MGRAGRVSEGVCLRLYPEIAFDSLEETTVPEILRVNLSHVILQLKAMGIHDPRSFSFLTPPDSNSIVKSFELLQSLGAVDERLELTAKGKEMSKLPLDPGKKVVLRLTRDHPLVVNSYQFIHYWCQSLHIYCFKANGLNACQKS